ncbi:helix-turn-helix domain-containing protein [Roseomonas sp. CECT 9278]|uniref:helix-turn-helix domain-containing protein n=1 Tax=Roseomonas sp. CECT 9278 TaxID=2845823 RepID=UPI001E56F736|nr:XRE family transcriptional regulator [Roseomonas sp. CECT 9278]CAH0148101.1 HTH-type transcriptional regulator SutR [Roseomonas sp. CECT 9278]
MSTETPAPLDTLLGQRIRREREARGWSIADLAAASGVSRAMISKIERTEASPTAALLGRLSGALHLTVSTLLARAEADAGPSRIARLPAQPLWTDPATRYRRRAVSPPGAEPELVEVELPPGARVAYPAASFAFLRGQVAWVLEGRLAIEEGAEEAVLQAGDALAFDLDTPRGHAYRNPSKSKPCRYLVALSRR